MSAVISTEVLVPEYQVILQSESVLLPTLNNQSARAIKGASSINYPTLAKRTAQRKTLATLESAGISAVENNYGDSVLLLNRILADAVPVKLVQEKQHAFDTIKDFTSNALKAFGREMDIAVKYDMLAALQGAGQNVVKTSDVIEDLAMIEKKMDEMSIPATDRFFNVNSTDYATIRKNPNFLRADALGSEKLTQGQVGMVFNFTIVRGAHLNAATLTDDAGDNALSNDSIAYHRNAVTWAIQGESTVCEAINALKQKKEVSISELWGCKVEQAGGFMVRYGANPA